MGYQKQNFANGEVLTASQLNHIENGIVDVESAVNEAKGVVDKIIDPTLSLSGKAADAKETGDAVGQIKEDKVSKNGYKEILPLNMFIIKTGINKFNGILHPGYMNLEGRVDSSASATYAYTDKIHLDGDNIISISNLSSDGATRQRCTARFITAFDSDDNILKNMGQETVGKNSAITIDSSVVDSIVITIFVNTPHNDFMVEFSEDISAIYRPYKEKISSSYFDLEEIQKYLNTIKLNGKTLLTFGDSIMAGDGNNGFGIGDFIAEKYSIELHDYSLGGATMGVTGNNDIYTQITTAINEVDNADIILIDGGTNDIVNIGGNLSIDTDPTVPIGSLVNSIFSVKDLADTHTFSGAMELGIFSLLEKYPNAIIIYIRVHQMGSRNQNLQIMYGERAIEICKRWGVAYIDLYNSFESRFPSIMRTEFLFDHTHPNANGYKKKYLPIIDTKIQSMIW